MERSVSIRTQRAEGERLGAARLAEAQAIVRERLAEAAEVLAALGVPRFPLEGRLLRPLAAYAFANDETTGAAGARFWNAALAVQLAHEASLLHDDMIDRAAQRRGAPTVAAEHGPAVALILGDHALTAAYRAAAMSGDLGFVCLFARAVERTVAGERAQAESAGATIDVARYREIVLCKSGELIGCATAVGPTLRDDRRARDIYGLGRRVGLLYQMLDDLLDYCPHAATGKPTLGDYVQRRWTWPLADLDDFDAIGFGADPYHVARLLARGAGRRALATFEAESLALRAELAAAGADPLLDDLVAEWAATARAAVRREERALRCERAV